VATLQQQLAERDEDVHNLQQRMCNETKQWVSSSLAHGVTVWTLDQQQGSGTAVVHTGWVQSLYASKPSRRSPYQ